MACIYIIDDDQTIREMLGEFFGARGHEVFTYGSAEEGHESLVEEQPEILLLDVKLPGINGIDFLERITKALPNTGIVMMTGHADYQLAVNAIKSGAKDFISKPFGLSDIDGIIAKILAENTRKQQLSYLEAANKRRVNDMVGVSPKMLDVFTFIDQVAESSKTSVLIQGETGTGKGLVARAIHYKSPRCDAPFIEVNCSAFQPTLLESELFGHEAGSFTGAKTRKKGLLELAHGGSFFLDEVGDMSMELQTKLLKVLEEQSFRRLGGTREIRVDTRIISATSKNLPEALAQNQFRTDLYYRLHVASVTMPPLRERGEDILLLAEHYTMVFALEFKKPIQGITPEGKSILLHHPWVGNVRELRNVIERAVLFEEGELISAKSIGLSEIRPPNELGKNPAPQNVTELRLPEDGISFEELERSFIVQALERTRGNKSQAARLLGYSRERMKYRLKKFNVESTT